jgi:RimK family alpha-L-glutamate ligase
MTRDLESWCSKQLRDAMTKQNITPECFGYRELVTRINYRPEVSANQKDLTKDIDALITRPLAQSSLEQIFFKMNLLRKLQRQGLLIVNPPRTIEQSVDKYHSLALFKEHGLPVPKTAVTESHQQALKCFDELEQDIILKPLFGSRGIGATRITDKDTAERIFRTITHYHGVLYLQRYIPHKGTDIRAFVIGNQVTAAIKRTSLNWKTNISQGAKPTPTKLSKELEDLAIKATNIIGCKIAGIDLIEGANGPKLIEINSQPGWKGLQSVTKTNIATQIINYIKTEFRK